MDKRHGFPAGGMLPAFAWLALASLPVRGEQATFNHDIRPILAENCFACHGPDSACARPICGWIAARRRSRRVRSSPGKPEESELVRRVFSGDADEMMPPPRADKTLTARQKEHAAAVDRRGRGVPAAVVVPCAGAAAAACGEEPVVGAQARSTASFSPAWNSAGCNRPRRPTAARSPGG